MKKAKTLLGLMVSFFLIGSTSLISAEELSDMKKIDDNAFIVPDKTDTSDTIFDVNPSNVTPYYVPGVLARTKTITVIINGEYAPTTRYYSEYYNNRWYAGTLNLNSFNPNTRVATYSGVIYLQFW